METNLLKKLKSLFMVIRSWPAGLRKFVMGLPLGAIGRVSRYVAGILLFLCLILFIIPALQRGIIHVPKPETSFGSGKESGELSRQKAELERTITRLDRKYRGLTPRSAFLVINTSGNRFYLYNNRKIYREGECSTGSYILLESENKTKWLFKTPKGRFSIQGKTTSPVWKKPDWAFVELGMTIPPENHPSRYEYGVLGDYALSLGHGYLIHGTLYKRFLGLPVTHGCVRLNDDDLEAVYRMLQVGSRVYIY
jgi:hypothetical protein